ncbi:MAG: hypothetical protein AUK63_533 [bacterium P3]|nr:MAG: hypothetical protein AUK63_533 [bacterium P3]KWW41989.1 MAG: hypothetical protein F083_640 [bacterium F083]
MEITGRLIRILAETRGESARGPWVRGGFVIETEGDYPRQVAFDCFGEDRVAMVKNIPMNSPVIVRFNPESREFNEKWYTNLRCSNVQQYVPGQMPAPATGYSYAAASTAAPATPAAAPAPAASPAPFASAPAAEMPNSSDDLPF